MVRLGITGIPASQIDTGNCSTRNDVVRTLVRHAPTIDWLKAVESRFIAVNSLPLGSAMPRPCVRRIGWRSRYVSDRHNHSSGPNLKRLSHNGLTMSSTSQTARTTSIC